MNSEANNATQPARRSHRRLVRWLLAALCVVLLFYVPVGYFGSGDMFGDHSRWRGINRGPADFGLQSETVSFNSTDGIPLKAWWLPASGTPRGAVIIAHGIDHTRQVMLPRATFLVHGGYDVLTPDLRCHGESGGTIASPGLLEARDILGAIRYIRSRGHSEPIALLGLSYGAVASLIATTESSDVVALISDGAFPNGEQLSLVRVPFLLASAPGAARATALVYYARSGVYLGPQLLSVIPYARRVTVPVLLISGGADWIVPTSRARQILSAIPSKEKELVVIPGAYHDTTYTTAPGLYSSAVLDFLKRAVKSN